MTAGDVGSSRPQYPTDGVDLFRRRVGAMNAGAILADSARSALGLRNVSEVWSERPLWYYWLSWPRGAFALELEANWTDPRSTATVGLFSLKHYPFGCDSARVLTSVAERRALASDWFDATGTPAFEMRSRIPASLFAVGMIEFHLDAEEQRALLLLTAQDRCQTVTPTGEILRDVPGWRLSRAFFDTFVGMQVLQMKTPPRRVSLGQRPGFEAVEQGAIRCRDTADRSMLSLAVELGPDKGPELLEDRASLGAIVRDMRQYIRTGWARWSADPLLGELPESWWTIPTTDHVIEHLPCSCCGSMIRGHAHLRRQSARDLRIGTSAGIHCKPVPT